MQARLLTANKTVAKEQILPFPTTTISEDKIVPRKTIVYETLVGPTVIKVAGEKNQIKIVL